MIPYARWSVVILMSWGFAIRSEPAAATTLPLRVTVSGELYAFGRQPVRGVLGERVEITALLAPDDFQLEIFEDARLARRTILLSPVGDVPFEITGAISGRFDLGLTVLDVFISQSMGVGRSGAFNQLQFRDYIPHAFGTTLIWREPFGSNTAARTGFPPNTVGEFFDLFERILKDQINWRTSNFPQFAAGPNPLTDSLALRNYSVTVFRVPEPNSPLIASLGAVLLASLTRRRGPHSLK